MSVINYRDLLVWQKAMDVVVESYRLAKLLPKSEAYGLASQMQRAAVSIPANIAEGQGRKHLGDYLYHLSVANGSLAELETHLILASRLSLLSGRSIEPLLVLTDGVGKMLTGLRTSLMKTRT